MRFAIYNHKGGVGKSTLTSHVAFKAIELQVPLYVLDSDRQRNSTSWISGHTMTSCGYSLASVTVSHDLCDLDTYSDRLCLIDCPPIFSVVEHLSTEVDAWLVPVDSRFSVDGLLNTLSELRGQRVIAVVNRSIDPNKKLSRYEVEQIKSVGAEVFYKQIPMHDHFRQAEALGRPVWKVPYGAKTQAAEVMQDFALWVLGGLKGKTTGGAYAQ
jgi:cellulose biosynthesis protein BcsQ